jgi:hypothetical protein
VPSDNPFQIELDSGRNDSNIAGVRPSAFRTGGFF